MYYWIETNDAGLRTHRSGDVMPSDAEAMSAADWLADIEAARAAQANALSVIIVSPRQFRRALLAAGLLDAVDALMADAKTPRALKIDWEFATEIRSDYPAWQDMIKALGKTQADLDALFAAASQIV